MRNKACSRTLILKWHKALKSQPYTQNILDQYSTFINQLKTK